MEPNPKSLCALEARIESLQIRLADNEQQLNKALIAFQEFAEAQTKQNKLIFMALEKLGFVQEPEPETIEDEETYYCPSDCNGCTCHMGYPPCGHCVEHGDPQDYV